jgi:hypothetical protein
MHRIGLNRSAEVLYRPNAAILCMVQHVRGHLHKVTAAVILYLMHGLCVSPCIAWSDPQLELSGSKGLAPPPLLLLLLPCRPASCSRCPTLTWIWP